MSISTRSFKSLLCAYGSLGYLVAVSACAPPSAPAPNAPAATTAAAPAEGKSAAAKPAESKTAGDDKSRPAPADGVPVTLHITGSGTLTLTGVTGGDAANDPILKASTSLYGGVREETLTNGLRIYLKPIPGAPTVTTMVAYKVGSADENLDHTGLSHYLEHLMFKGTETIKPGDIDRMTLRNGGANNAYTAEDHTIFHFDFAADRWEQALGIEADRMRNLRIDTAHEFEQEKGAVIEELRQDEDHPWDLEQKLILPVLFGPESPYGHPVIGQTEHVRSATAEIIKGHYDKWYHPNNAALVVCGGFDPDQALAKINELFGPIPKAELPPRKELTPPKGERPEIVKMTSKFEAPRLLIGFNTVLREDPDYYALDIVQGLLTGGKTGRLYKKLVEELQVATEVNALNMGGRYPGWFSVQVTLLPDVKIEDVEKTILEELRQIGRNGITEAELKRVQNLYVAHELFEREGVHELADSIAQSVVLSNLDLAKSYLPKIVAVTPADVQRVCRKYFDAKQRVSVYSTPVPKPEPGDKDKKKGEKETAAMESSRSNLAASHSRQLRPNDGGGAAGGDNVANILKGARREVLDNGLTLLLLERHRLPIVVVEAYVAKTRLYESAEQAGLATMVGDLLEEGTATRSGREVSEAIEDTGGSIAFDQVGGVLKTLAQHRRVGLEVLFDCLANAEFPEDAFARIQGQMLAELDERERQPEAKAQDLYRKLAYGDHPLARPEAGNPETVAKLTRDDCRKYHRRLFVPNNTVIAIVGDFDSQQVIDEIKALTAPWKRGDLEKLKLPEVKQPAEFTQKILSLPQAAQLHVFLGHPGIRRDNPDYYKLQVMDYVLGVGPGFTDRLSSRLRDRNGLAYSVGADIHTSASEEPGMFTCHIGADPKNFDKVKTLLLAEINKFLADEPPTKDEVADAKQYLLGNLPFKSSTGDRLAGELIEIERYKLGQNYLGDYQKAIEGVTVEDVIEVAKKYIDPKHMILVASGAVDEDGKPLPMEEGKAAQEK